ncbi:EamA family transporter [Streptomyces sp. NPDC050732]|uniref:EamA family transporter n=1 Tax=Streptomyces sp. NPDC050732 TaxID=3154632 RepID=UPI0034337F4C
MGALLALASAACYGIVDFAGGLLSRRIHFTVVTFLGQIGGLLLALVIALAVPAEAVRFADVAWGALSGVGSAVAMQFLNRGLSRGAMSVVIPVSAVTGVALSVLCGVLFLGDRPTPLAWLGICVTVPALWLVSAGGAAGGSGEGSAGGGDGAAPSARVPVDGLIASAGVAVQYIGLAQAGAASGVWPVAAGRLAAVFLLLPNACRYAAALRRPGPGAGPGPKPGAGPAGLPGLALAVLIGAGAALGLILYFWATQQQMLAVAVVLASLYPAVPTALGLAVLGERVTRAQTRGLVGAVAAVVLLTLG